MIKFLIVIGALYLGLCDAASALDKDKQLHFAASALLTAGGYTVCRMSTSMSKTGCAITTAASVLAIGALKELGDRNHNSLTESSKDLLADSAGIGLGLTITVPW